ncbi:unnamed protein product [Medioppia subpectinata]|uniref:Actin-related protein 3 n=1 Tax=Medioppia subpectinata TaxID=1979941 RepID=A0A7R9Q515_9ACAR|nr:unnamed protein product [Medioppia subpectinata]CAG2112937.1 unnamed protein product [Medioppia subpectinata]
MAGRLPAIVIDSGTGYAVIITSSHIHVHPMNDRYTKLGFSSNNKPEFIPSVVAIKEEPNVGDEADRRLTIGIDVSVGEEALSQSAHTVKYPIQHGVVEDWDLMRLYWEECIYKYLKTKPEDHYFLVADPPLNTPENCESMAEIMFESFSVPGLCIAAQPVLALIASWASQEVDERESTGIIIESGDCGTHCTPVVDHNVIKSCVQHISIAGRHITLYVQNVLRERESAIPPTQSLATAEAIKEQFCYVCPDIDTEFERYYSNPNEWMKKYSATNAITKQPFEVDVRFERFLGPELLFSPESATPLSETVDNCIQNCPINVRPALYKNIVLSGGSTMFKNFGRRLQRDIQRIANRRADPMEVRVVSHHTQRYAVWFGGSMLTSTPQLESHFFTRAQYEEHGSSVWVSL